jgi:hypothetical protein
VEPDKAVTVGSIEGVIATITGNTTRYHIDTVARLALAD